MQKALFPYLISLVDGTYLILRFFRRKALLNLMVGFAVAAAPPLIVAVKLIATRTGSGYAGLAVAVLATAAFAAFSYYTALAVFAVKSQWEKNSVSLRPTAVEIAAYAIGAAAIIYFALAIFL